MGPRSIGADKLMNMIKKGELAVRKAEDRLQLRHLPVANSEAPSPMAQQNQIAAQMQE